jgi:ornithine carbamoyltransferase
VAASFQLAVRVVFQQSGNRLHAQKALLKWLLLP